MPLRVRIRQNANNRIIQIDRYSAFNSVPWPSMLEQMATYTAALTGFVTKCYDERSASGFFQITSGCRTKFQILPWSATRRHFRTCYVLPACHCGR